MIFFINTSHQALSGLLDLDREAIKEKYSASGFTEVDDLKMDEWIEIDKKIKPSHGKPGLLNFQIKYC